MQSYIGNIVATAVPAEDIQDGDSVQLKDIYGEEALSAAESNGSIIYALDPDTLEPSTVLFDGANWLQPRPTQARMPDVTVPTPSYVDERTEVMQSELEALVDVMEVAVGSRVSAKVLSDLKSRISTARVAMRDGDSLGMAKVAQVLSDTRDAAIFSVERAEEISDARALLGQ